jgi:hypothetical protein
LLLKRESLLWERQNIQEQILVILIWEPDPGARLSSGVALNVEMLAGHGGWDRVKAVEVAQQQDLFNPRRGPFP